MTRLQANRFSRRSFLGRTIGMTVGLGALAGLVACSQTAAPASPTAPAASGTAAPAQAPAQTNGAAKTVNLVWSGWILDQNPIINKLIDNYAKETGVKVTTSSAPDDLQQKVLLEANQKKSTWGGWEGHTAFLNTAPLVAANALAPFDSYLTEADKKDLLPTSIAEVTYKGQMYEFPFRVSPMTMIYRPSILEKLGYQQPPDSWDGVFELCEKAKANLSTSGKPFYGIVIWSTAWYGLWEVMETLTPEPFDTNAGLANMDIPEATQAMDIMKKLYSYAPTDTLSTDPTNYFQSGNVAMMLIYVLQAQRVKKALNGDVRIGRVPKTAKAQGTIFWSSGANLFADYGNVEDAAKFWLWLSNQKELYDSLWVQNGSPPNRLSMLQKFNDQKGKDLDPGFWDASDMQAHSQGIPNSLWIATQAKYTKSETENYLLGKTSSVEQAIQAIKKQTADEIAKQKQ